MKYKVAIQYDLSDMDEDMELDEWSGVHIKTIDVSEAEAQCDNKTGQVSDAMLDLLLNLVSDMSGFCVSHMDVTRMEGEM